MYERSSTLVPPGDSRQTLWRYMSSSRLEELLRTEDLYFRNVLALEDGLEGALTMRTHEHLANWFQHHNKSSREVAYAEVLAYQESQRSFYVNCWHMNDSESYLMWKTYAHRGYAIETTFERVQCSFESSPGVVTGGVVAYVDFRRDLTAVGNVFNHVATKDLPYRDEREFRLVFWAQDPRNHQVPEGAPGLCVKVNVPMLIRSVRASPFAEPMSGALAELLEQHALSIGSSSVPIRTRPSAA